MGQFGPAPSQVAGSSLCCSVHTDQDWEVTLGSASVVANPAVFQAQLSPHKPIEYPHTQFKTRPLGAWPWKKVNLRNYYEIENMHKKEMAHTYLQNVNSIWCTAKKPVKCRTALSF